MFQTGVGFASGSHHGGVCTTGTVKPCQQPKLRLGRACSSRERATRKLIPTEDGIGRAGRGGERDTQEMGKGGKHNTPVGDPRTAPCTPLSPRVPQCRWCRQCPWCPASPAGSRSARSEQLPPGGAVGGHCVPRAAEPGTPWTHIGACRDTPRPSREPQIPSRPPRTHPGHAEIAP